MLEFLVIKGGGGSGEGLGEMVLKRRISGWDELGGRGFGGRFISLRFVGT